MKNKRIEHDLLRLFKNNPDNVLEIICAINNRDYHFEISYLNNIPHYKMTIYIEKLIALVTNTNIDLIPTSDILNLIYDFSKKVKDVTYKDIDKITSLSLKYDAKLLGVNFKRNWQRYLTASGSLILSILILANLSKKEKLDIQEEEYITKEEEVNEDNFQTNPEIVIGNNTFVDNTIKSIEDDKNVWLENNITTESNLDFQNSIVEDELSKKDKINNILDNYDLTQEQFDIICAIVMAEAKSESYVDGYAVINCMYNRCVSKLWNDYISNLYGDNAGSDLYMQATASGQFVVYEEGLYEKFLGVKEGQVIDAVIDFLTTKNIMHYYLSYRSADTSLDEYEQFTPNGNKFFDYMLEEDRMITEEESRGL